MVRSSLTTREIRENKVVHIKYHATKQVPSACLLGQTRIDGVKADALLIELACPGYLYPVLFPFLCLVMQKQSSIELSIIALLIGTNAQDKKVLLSLFT